MALGTYLQCLTFKRWSPPMEGAFISQKVSGDEVGPALEKCREQAIQELGSKTPVLVQWFWAPEWIGTVWRA